MDPYAVNMVPGTSVAVHISRLHAAMVHHRQDPYSEFHSPTARARRLLWSLPTVSPWVEFRTRYHQFMTTGVAGWDGPRFQTHGVWNTIVSELMTREDLERRGITTEKAQYIFPLLYVPPPQAHPAPPAPAPEHSLPSPPLSPAMGTSHGNSELSDNEEVQLVEDIPESPELIVLSSDEDHVEDPEEDPEEDPDEEIVIVDSDTTSIVSSNNSSTGGEPDDAHDPNYDPTVGH